MRMPDRPPQAASPRGHPRTELVPWAVLFLAVAVGLVVNLGVRPLEFEEPRRSTVALEMMLRGNFLVPTTNGAPYFNKPPVFNWLLVACMRLFGSTADWVPRVPTVVSMLLLALVLWRFARRHLGERTALTAAAFLLTFPTLLFYGTLYGEIDVFYALVLTLQALAIFSLEQRGRPFLLFAVSYLLTALGFLTKGMPSLALQALTLVAWLVHVRRWRWLLSWAHLAGLAVFGLCVGGWLTAYTRYEPAGPLLVKLLFDATERTAAAGTHGLGRIALQLVDFPVQLLALCAPWSLFLPGLFERSAWERLRSTPFLRFCVVLLAANVAPYWLSPGNKPRYMFMFLPFLAALLAVAAEELAEAGWYARAVRWILAAALAVAGVGAIAFPLTPWRSLASPLWAWLLVAALVAALAVLAWRAGSLRAQLAPVLLALAVARVGYDLVVPAFRRSTSPETFYEQVGDVLSREYRDRPVLLLGRTEPRTYTVPLTGPSFTIPEREWFPFSLTFHFSARRGELLRYAGALEPGKLYLAHTAYPVDVPHEVVRVFDCPRNDIEDLKLIRVLQ